jgi:hypothetical protein
VNLLNLQKLAEKGYAGGETLGDYEYFNPETGEATDWHPGDILQWFVAVEIAETYSSGNTDDEKLKVAIEALEHGVKDLQGAINLLKLKKHDCRFCEHLKNVAPPRQKYIGMCGNGKSPDTCGDWQLAECYEGHNPLDKFFK